MKAFKEDQIRLRYPHLSEREVLQVSMNLISRALDEAKACKQRLWQRIGLFVLSMVVQLALVSLVSYSLTKTILMALLLAAGYCAYKDFTRITGMNTLISNIYIELGDYKEDLKKHHEDYHAQH